MGSSNLPLRRQTQDSPKTEDKTPQNRTQTSVFGDPTTTRRKRQLDHPKTGFLTSVIGDPFIGRRKRKLQTPKTGPKPPPSASPGTLAENGSQQADQTPPNLHHRRQIQDSPKTEVTGTEQREK